MYTQEGAYQNAIALSEHQCSYMQRILPGVLSIRRISIR